MLACQANLGPLKIIVSIGANAARDTIMQWFDERGFEFATAIHPSAQIAREVQIGHGTVIMARVVVNTGTTIGRGCILNTCSSVDHDCQLGSCVHVAPGARLCGGVKMEDRSMLGSGGVIIPNVRVAPDAVIGAGAVLVREAAPHQTYVGVPARSVADAKSPLQATTATPAPNWRTSPEQFNTLFTCVGRRTELIQAFRNAMNKLGLRGRLYASDVSPFSAAAQTADGFIPVMPVEDSQYIPSLLNAVRQRNIGLLVPLTDWDLVDLARNKKQFEAAGCQVMVGSEEVVTFCRDKRLLPQLLESLHLPAVRTVTLEQFRDEPFFPAFVKPCHGSGSVGAASVRSMQDLDAHLRLHGQHMVIQTHVPGQEYTVDVYKSRDGQTRCIVPRQRLAVRSGEVEQGVTVYDEQIIQATRILSDSLENLWGVFCCQCRRPPGGVPYFFEINPRFGGGCPLSIAAGADMPAYLLQDVLGWEIEADGAFIDHLLMMRYPAATFRKVERLQDLPGFDDPTSI